MRFRPMFFLAGAISTATSLPVRADDMLTIEKIGNDLTTAGYASVVEKIENPNSFGLGKITTTVGGGNKIALQVTKCAKELNTVPDSICDVQFNLIVPDPKNNVDDKALANMNNTLLYSKATKIIRNDNSSVIRINYSLYMNRINSSKSVIEFLQIFMADISRIFPALAAKSQ